MVQIHAPAKLNLYLEVTARRADGFHEIETLMAPISIYDTLYFAEGPPGKIELTCGWSPGLESRDGWRALDAQQPVFGRLPAVTDNLVWRAVELLRLRAGVEAGASIRLIKRIPSAAGLGGASSDAAAALIAANEVWKLGWNRTRLAELAGELGSDIPFFLDATPAWCLGRGEIVEPFAGLPRLHVVVAKPPEGLSTADVYRRCRPAERPASRLAYTQTCWGGNPAGIARGMLNRLQQPAAELSPWMDRLRDTFGRLAFLGHQMSGSGSSYFGICRHACQARRLTQRLQGAGVGYVFRAATLAKETAPHEL